ncbi:MAG: S1 RNA-binding domain-containing protein [archaeon]|nr:S1 RNA-binding domain-containing protein [archaeon]
MANEKTPVVGEIVVVKVNKVLDYGAFCELLEYDNAKGFVHVSQIASRWVKNIRNFVKENQIRAALVLNIEKDKGQIDLSLTKVSQGDQRVKIEEWKQGKRVQKLLEILAQQNKKSFEQINKEIVEPLIELYGSLYSGLQEIAIIKEIPFKLDKKLSDSLLELVEKNIEVPQKTLRGMLELESTASNGVEIVKNALIEAKKSVPKTSKLEVIYSGSGRYSIKSTSFDFKLADKALQLYVEKATALMIASHGKAKFEKVEQN